VRVGELSLLLILRIVDSLVPMPDHRNGGAPGGIEDLTSVFEMDPIPLSKVHGDGLVADMPMQNA
jgi:hypothetical protein